MPRRKRTPGGGRHQPRPTTTPAVSPAAPRYLEGATRPAVGPLLIAIAATAAVTVAGLAGELDRPAVSLPLLLLFDLGAVMLESKAWRSAGRRQMLITVVSAALAIPAALAAPVGAIMLAALAGASVRRFGTGVGSAMALGSGVALSLVGADPEFLTPLVLGLSWPALAVGILLGPRPR